MHSGSVSIQSFAVGIWQSHPLQHHTPRFECLHEGACKLYEQTPTGGGELVQNSSTPPSQ